ncbi:hypothetical protein [Helicobacter sp. 12S02634-8]|nr:hypothetical protein [Helicobacter sp. 12S02634-8]
MPLLLLSPNTSLISRQNQTTNKIASKIDTHKHRLPQSLQALILKIKGS